jgi:hypothetical protein
VRTTEYGPSPEPGTGGGGFGRAALGVRPAETGAAERRWSGAERHRRGKKRVRLAASLVVTVFGHSPVETADQSRQMGWIRVKTENPGHRHLDSLKLTLGQMFVVS